MKYTLLALVTLGALVGIAFACHFRAPGPSLDRVVTSGLIAQELAFVGDGRSGFFHRRSCPTGRRIPRDRCIFFRNRSDALNHQFVGCGVCRP